MASHFDVKRQWGFATIAMVCFFLLYLPIATLVVFAFNAGPSLAVWEGVSLKWFVAAWNNSAVQEAAMRSLIIAVFAATIATVAFAGLAFGAIVLAGALFAGWARRR